MNLDDLPNPSTVLTYSRAAEAQASIDEEITKRILLLCDLRTRRNSFSPVFRFAPETLGLVFIHCARDHYENEKSTRHSAPPIPGWVNVSYVCRHWRNVALQCPTLWSYHFIVSQRWTDELLARSKQASLKIRMVYYERRQRQWWLDLMAKLMNHVERIQELHLSLPIRLLPTMFLRALRMESLELMATTSHFHGVDEPLTPFDGQTPVLRTLKVSDYGVSLRSLTLGGLTTLSLCRVPRELRFNVGELLVILSHMEDLVYLYLEESLASARGFTSGDASNVPPKITLPRLSHLLVAAPHSTVAAFLSCVTVPSNTEVKLHSQSDRGSSIDDFVPISRFFAQRTIEVSALPNSSIRSLIMDYGSDKVNFIFSTLERGFNVHSRKISALGWDCNSPLVVGVTISPSVRGNMPDILSDMCCSIASKNVHSLHVINPPSSPAFWRTLLSHLEELQHIKLSRGTMLDLASLLSVTADEPVEDDGHATDDEDPNNVLVPALEELELEDIQFWNERDVQPPAEVQSLCAALSSRPQSEGRLTISECDVDGDCPLWHFNMVGQWGEGYFDTLEEECRSCHSRSGSENSEGEGEFLNPYW